MKSEIVIGIDSSTTSTKAIAWDNRGNSVVSESVPVRLSSPQPNYYEQNSDDWWDSLVLSLRNLTAKIDKNKISAIAISNQRETFVCLDSKGNPVRPAIIWLDERCKNNVEEFAKIIGEERIHQITGKPKDFAPVVYRLAWMKENEQNLFNKTYKFLDVQGFLVYKLTDSFKTSWASADPLGIFDLENKKWSKEILNRLNLEENRLPETYSPGIILGYVSRKAAQTTGLREGTIVVAGGGDGQAAGSGVNALNSNRAYLNLGTAVVSGTYVKNYVADKNFRTMASCTNVGYYCETSLRSGTFLVEWFLQKVLKIVPSRKINIYRQLEKEASLIKPGCDGLLLLPYWNAVMNPYWDPNARGAIIGFNSGHNRGHIFRAILEGIAMEQTLASIAVETATCTNLEEFAVIGGGSRSDLWHQIIADISNKKVLKMTAGEASSLGAGIAAAVGAGWYKTFEDAAKNMVSVKSTLEPNTGYAEIYHKQLLRYKEIYPTIKKI